MPARIAATLGHPSARARKKSNALSPSLTKRCLPVFFLLVHAGKLGDLRHYGVNVCRRPRLAPRFDVGLCERRVDDAEAKHALVYLVDVARLADLAQRHDFGPREPAEKQRPRGRLEFGARETRLEQGGLVHYACAPNVTVPVGLNLACHWTLPPNALEIVNPVQYAVPLMVPLPVPVPSG